MTNAKMALNQGTIRHLPLDEAINVAKQAGYQGFGVWSERVENYIESGHSEQEACDLIKKSGLKIVEVIFLKEWMFVTGERKKQSLSEIEEICRIAKNIGAECICAPAYGTEGDLEDGIRNFQDFCDIAAKYQVKVALEFVPTFKVDNLLSAYNVVKSADRENGGILVDAFHVFKGPTKLEDFSKVPAEKIFLVHMCDCDELPDIDIVEQARGYRVFPGEGSFALNEFLMQLKTIGYHGSYSLEVLNSKFLVNDLGDSMRYGREKLYKFLSERGVVMQGYNELANAVREVMLEDALQGDSHLSSGLGIVELMIALFEVFDFNSDKMLFDIGHQRLPYQLLKEWRKSGKLCYNAAEEKYDMFTYAGFAGLSASSALGFAISNPGVKAIALIGDGAITGGEVYEALNHIGELQSNVLVILNQNGMSISKNVGSLADGVGVQKFAEGLKFEYIGLVDGYDTDNLITVLAEIKKKQYPVLLHVKTDKGRGFEPAEEDPRTFHSVFYPYDKEKKEFIQDQQQWKRIFVQGMDLFERKCLGYMGKYDNVYITTPANPPLKQIRAHHMDRFIDTGINEQHCMTLSTTLAEMNNRVIMVMFGCFLSRCFSQIYDLCAQNAPLMVLLNMPGITAYGATHQAVFDVNMLRMTPNATIMHPANLEEYGVMIDYAFNANRPVFLQAPKNDVKIAKERYDTLEFGKGSVLTEGDKLTVLPVGSMFDYALTLAKKYKGVEIINPRFLKPFDFTTLNKSVEKTKKLLILEDGLQKGGIGEEVLSYLVTNGVQCVARHVACKDIVLTYTRTDYEFHNREYGLTMDACEKAASELFRE